MASDWSQLNGDLVEKIGEGLDFYSDYRRLRAVCTGWRSSLPANPKHLPLDLPYLILPQKPNETQRGFFSVFLGQIYPYEFPEGGDDKLFRGSSHGWIVAVEKGPSIHLINPLTKSCMELPPITTFPEVLEYRPDSVGEVYITRAVLADGMHTYISYSDDIRGYYIDKVVLSSPGDTDFRAMVVYGETSKLACCKCGDKEWTVVGGETVPFRDVIFYNGNFYALGCDGVVFIIRDLDSSSPMAVPICEPPDGFSNTVRQYLVESRGDFLIIARDVEHFNALYRTSKFRIIQLKLNSSGTEGRWVKSLDGRLLQLSKIGDSVLFLGQNCSVCFSAPNFPGCQGNSIYFTDDYLKRQREDGTIGGADMGVFNITDENVMPLPGYKHHSQVVCPPPIWVMPSV